MAFAAHIEQSSPADHDRAFVRPIRRWGSASAVAAIFAILALIFSPAAASADPPLVLPNQITDTSGVLNDGQKEDIQAALDQLSEDHQIDLWVAFVPDFNEMGGQAWADQTATKSTLSGTDVLLAVATTEGAYYLDVPPGLTNITQSDIDSIKSDATEPALADGDWAGAAIATAGALGDANAKSGGMSVSTLLIGGGAVIVGTGGVVLYSRKRKSDRDKASLEAAKNIAPDDIAALNALPLPTLDERAQAILVETDNAIASSQEELELARSEFGDAAVAPFAQAFDKAKATLAGAFGIRQKLDDAIPESPEQRRQMLIDIISSCGRADQELDARVDEFDTMRDLLINAPARLDALTQAVVAVSVRLPESEKILNELKNQFPAPTLAPVAGNVTMAGERLTLAEQSIEQGRDAVALPAGKQGAAVTAIRTAEAALDQARKLLDAVDHAADDIRNAIATLPAAMDDVQQGITAADAYLAQGGDRLAAAKAGAQAALAHAQTSKDSDPLGAFNQIVAADAQLDALLAEAQEQKQQLERAQQRLAQDILAAQAQVTAAGDFLNTRRGVIGAEARTRYAEAQRHLQAAQQLQGTDPSTALQHAQAATTLATHALRAAQSDVSTWEANQRPRGGSGGGGNAAGAILGGILINSVLRGGGGGPRSYGGPSSSGRGGGFGGGGFGGGGGGRGSRGGGGGGRF
ncbi:TPM domain-containing protein [Rhodococcus globerulus]|uniref:TPM domain-containing protein n=1 Tax=Rhodococcus globerulus TaxID=33008 RepID=UPI00301B1D91